MTNKKIIEQIKTAALQDEKKRKDRRYKVAMAFLVRKGFLKTNLDFAGYYLARVRIEDMIWAGQNVEPRILEVLPAAILRLPKAFTTENIKKLFNLDQVLNDLRHQKEDGPDFLNMPYKKMKMWMNISLNDRRTKTENNKKVMKTFRLSPQAIFNIDLLKKKNGISEAAVLENLLAKEINE